MSPILSLELRDTKSPNVKVLHLDGEVDETVLDQIESEVDSIINDAEIHQIIFDLANLKFINSKGIGYLVSVHTHLAKEGRNMVLTNASQPVMDVLALVGLTSIIPYYPTLEEAEAVLD